MKKLIIILLMLLTGLYVQAQKVTLTGSKYSQEIQNNYSNKHTLVRIKDEEELKLMVSDGYLEPISDVVLIDTNLRKEFKYCLPWVNIFLNDLVVNFTNEFSSYRRVKLNSAVRTVEYQKNLRKINSNAAINSSHTTGATIDITKLGLSLEEIKWLREYLLDLERVKVVEATEENSQLVFHIMVFKNYETHTYLQ